MSGGTVAQRRWLRRVDEGSVLWGEIHPATRQVLSREGLICEGPGGWAVLTVAGCEFVEAELVPRE